MVRHCGPGRARYPGMEGDQSASTSKIILDVKELREQFALQIGRFDPLCEMADYLFDQLVMNALNVQGQMTREPRATLGRLVRTDEPSALENLLDRTWINISSLASYMERNNAGRPGILQSSNHIPGRFVGDTVTLYYDPVFEDYMSAYDEMLTDGMEQPLCVEEIAEQQEEEDMEYVLEQQGIATNPADLPEGRWHVDKKHPFVYDPEISSRVAGGQVRELHKAVIDDLPWDTHAGTQGAVDYMSLRMKSVHQVIGESEQKGDDLLGVSTRKF